MEASPVDGERRVTLSRSTLSPSTVKLITCPGSVHPQTQPALAPSSGLLNFCSQPLFPALLALSETFSHTEVPVSRPSSFHSQNCPCCFLFLFIPAMGFPLPSPAGRQLSVPVIFLE